MSPILVCNTRWDRAKTYSSNRPISEKGYDHIVIGDDDPPPSASQKEDTKDTWNYALLLALYVLQGIPMGLSAMIPFLIQQKAMVLAQTSHTAAAEAKVAYNAQAIFALCSWPFSLKLLWAPVVDAVYWRRFGRRKSWLIPCQVVAGVLMVGGSGYVERQLGLGELGQQGVHVADERVDVRGVTAFFFALYFLMATQDIAVDAWAITMLSKKNRGRGPVCNSIGQNLGYFFSFVGFLALNDDESSEKLWRPLLGWERRPGTGIVSLEGFIRFCGVLMLCITSLVAVFKREVPLPRPLPEENGMRLFHQNIGEDAELDAGELGLHETYRRLWAVCKLSSVRWLFLILITYRVPTALSDNVKFLKAVEFGLSKQTMALLSPALILPLGIVVPIIATKVWHGHPLQQFMHAYKIRVTIVAIFDVLMLLAVRSLRHNTDLSSKMVCWFAIIGSTGLQAIVHSLQFNAQMIFFAHRVDPAIGGSYMTLLNTAANLGGTWPSSFVMYLVGQLTIPPDCAFDEGAGKEVCTGGWDAYFPLQLVLSVLGCMWIFFLGNRVKYIAALPDDAWRTHIVEEEDFGGVDIGNKEKEPKHE